MPPANDKSAIDKGRAEKLYRALREHISRSADGRRLIAAFESNPDKGGAALAAYLRKQLPEDEALANRLAAALGGEAQFATIVTGGHVDQIINIARLGVLSLTVKKYFYVFRNVRQVVAFLLIVLLAGAGIAYGVWRASQPQWMDGDFNIAVAEFVEVPGSTRPTIAPIVSRMLSNFLDDEYELSEFELTVQVQHDKIGVVHGPVEAEDLARSINADLVIYGDVLVQGDTASVSPKFYVAESFRQDASELTGSGQYQLEYPFVFSTSDIVSPESGVNTILRQRASILAELTKALIYLTSHELEPAFKSIQNAIHQAEVYGDFKGKETLYLFGAVIARLRGDLATSQEYVGRALKENETYARAYIELANTYYVQQDWEAALQYYERAAQIEDQPYGAYLVEKANLGIGNIYTVWYQTAGAEEKPALANAALSHYRVVIESYERAHDPHLSEHAAWAHYGSGIIHQLEGNLSNAIGAFEQALALTQNPDLMMKAQERLDRVR